MCWVNGEEIAKTDHFIWVNLWSKSFCAALWELIYQLMSVARGKSEDVGDRSLYEEGVLCVASLVRRQFGCLVVV